MQYGLLFVAIFSRLFSKISILNYALCLHCMNFWATDKSQKSAQFLAGTAPAFQEC